ncbi:unnamed protein product [Clonostachys chloroleuca]|uniref:Xylanolytic transcriptional activator regulatory domain-containing protein n=1 Tax=Clonostachys chloroleuca TaxID=1926264 RepID=A0AA35PZ45_9HYPO|nr:unnamed protein product [Clonostachys chloroleuca]
MVFISIVDYSQSILVHLQQLVAQRENDLRIADSAATSGDCRFANTLPLDQTQSFASRIEAAFRASMATDLGAMQQSWAVSDDASAPPASRRRAADSSEREETGHSGLDQPLQALTEIPPEITRRLFQDYTTRVLPMWPVFHAEELWTAFNDVMTNPASSVARDFYTYTVAMVLAISIVSSTSPSETTPKRLSVQLCKFATQHLSDFPDPSLCTLKAILLRLQYCYLMPDVGDPALLASTAMRIAVDLGLHVNHRRILSPVHARTTGQTQSSFSDADGDEVCESRKLLFWVVYIMERSVCITLCRRSSLDDSHISTPLPQAGENLEAFSAEGDHQSEPSIPSTRRFISPQMSTRLLWVTRLRQLQSEILRVRFLGGRLPDGLAYEEWFRLREAEALEWNSNPSGQARGSRSSNIPEWSQVGTYQTLLMLYRPSPREPWPPADVMVRAFGVAKAFVESAFAHLSKRSIYLPWHGVNQCLQAALVFLFSVRHYRDSLLETRSTSEIVQSSTIFTGIFTFHSQSWSVANAFASLYGRIQQRVMTDLLRPPHRRRSRQPTTSTDELEELLLCQGPAEVGIQQQEEIDVDASLQMDPPGAVPCRQQTESRQMGTSQLFHSPQAQEIGQLDLEGQLPTMILGPTQSLEPPALHQPCLLPYVKYLSDPQSQRQSLRSDNGGQLLQASPSSSTLTSNHNAGPRALMPDTSIIDSLGAACEASNLLPIQTYGTDDVEPTGNSIMPAGTEEGPFPDTAMMDPLSHPIGSSLSSAATDESWLALSSHAGSQGLGSTDDWYTSLLDTSEMVKDAVDPFGYSSSWWLA